MDFWDRFLLLCIDKKMRPNPVAAEIGIASGTLTKWSKGISYPNGIMLIKIAKYFNCSIDYLVGISDQERPSNSEISSEELLFLKKLRSLPEDSQDEIIHMVNYKYDQYQKKRNRLSSTSESTTTNDSQDMLA